MTFQKLFYLALVAILTSPPNLFGETVIYDLVIDETQVELLGKSRAALTIDGGIPGPTLRFREGDVARITVHNKLRRQDTSLHWHGLLLPNAMDGVPYLTTEPIKPGQSHVFEFPLKHSGTYWYHSHTGLQEQQGVYGSIVVTPKEGEQVEVDHDFVAVLSDWTNENPKNVMRTLMRGSDWYAVKKGNAQSIVGAAKEGALKEYFAREKSRMPPMDISDIAYDAFLLNGKEMSTLSAKPGDRIRLRVINAGASSYFYLQSAAGPLTIVAADGPEVVPVEVDRLLIGMAETYDVVITVPASGLWEFRATAQDNSGHSSLFIGEEGGVEHRAEALPFPNLYTMDEMLAPALEDDDVPLDTLRSRPRPSAPYAFLKSRKPTSYKTEPRSIELRLTGDMTRYLWSFNGETLAEDSTIPVKKGEVLRIELINDSMMHHPLHLHGHFFRLLNRHGENSPLKHTVEVPPMGRRTIEFLANDEGDWFFHCHLLYHMDAGMARVFSYEAAENPNYEPTVDPKLINPWYFMGDATVLNNMTMGMVTAMTGRENFSLMWDYGFEDGHDENEYDLYWSHYFDPNLSTFLGYRLTDDMMAENRFFGGVSYRLPYLIRTELSVDSEGDFRLAIGREIQITRRLSIYGDVEYDTNTEWEFNAGASYLINQELSLITGYHSDHGFGAGVTLRF